LIRTYAVEDNDEDDRGRDDDDDWNDEGRHQQVDRVGEVLRVRPIWSAAFKTKPKQITIKAILNVITVNVIFSLL
jgi:hypothetical protein